VTVLLIVLGGLLVLSVTLLVLMLRRRRPVTEDVARKAAEKTVAEALRRLDGHVLR